MRSTTEFTGQTTGSRPDQFRADGMAGILQDVAERVANSTMFPFIDPRRVSSLRVEALPIRGDSYFFVDAVYAVPDLADNLDRRRIPPDQIRSMVAKLRQDAERLADGQYGWTGLTTLQRGNDGIAAMYRAQLTGNGGGARDLTGFLATGRLPEEKDKVQNGEKVEPFVFVAVTVTRKDDVVGTIRKLGRYTYTEHSGSRGKNNKSKGGKVRR